MDTERQKKFSFLDIEVIREQGKFSNTIYRKPTFSGVHSNFESFLPSLYKLGVVHLGLQMLLYLLGLENVPYRINFFEKDVS